MSNLHIFFLVLLIACGVKQPVEIIDPTTYSGAIAVSSDPGGAQIILDKISTGKITPDTLFNILPGQHLIEVVKDGYKTPEQSFLVMVKKDSLTQVSFLLEKIILQGYLGIETTPAGAEIFVDGQTTGKVSPDTVALETGYHEITARKNGYSDQTWPVTVFLDSLIYLKIQLPIFQRIMMEAFGNVSCKPCTTSAFNLELFTHNHKDGAFALMEYYAYWPSANDPFYLQSPNDVKERVENFYRVTSLPTLKMNGAQGVDATNYDDIAAKYQFALASPKTSLGLSLSKLLDTGQLIVKIEMYDFATVLNNSQLRLFLAVSEDSIHYDTAPGDNGLKDFNFVFRRFLSSRKGDIINNSSNPALLEYHLQWPANWNFTNCKCIAFIQDISTKQIIQSTIN